MHVAGLAHRPRELRRREQKMNDRDLPAHSLRGADVRRPAAVLGAKLDVARLHRLVVAVAVVPRPVGGLVDVAGRQSAGGRKADAAVGRVDWRGQIVGRIRILRRRRLRVVRGLRRLRNGGEDRDEHHAADDQAEDEEEDADPRAAVRELPRWPRLRPRRPDVVRLLVPSVVVRRLRERMLRVRRRWRWVPRGLHFSPA